MTTRDLSISEFNPYYKKYIDLVPDHLELIAGFYKGLNIIESFFNAIPKDKQAYKYAEDKWTVKEVFQHIIDTERVFMYRCFRIARHDRTPLVGYEQNDYIKPSGANDKEMKFLLEEYSITRKNFIVLLKSLSHDDLIFIGNANGSNTSARSVAFSVLGHELWHLKVIKEHYL